MSLSQAGPSLLLYV